MKAFAIARQKIIVTRPEPDASRFAAMADDAGYDPIISPAMRIDFKSQGIDFSDVSALAFTSANGVRALAALNQPMPLSLPVFAVGPVTARAAMQAGHTNVECASGDVASLAALIVRLRPTGGKVLHIAGADRAGDLEARLAAQSVGAKSLTLYDALPAHALSAGAEAFLRSAPESGWVALFSPRTARLFIGQARQSGLLKNLGGLRAACLSAAVADEAEKARWKSINIADEPTGEAILVMIGEQHDGTAP